MDSGSIRIYLGGFINAVFFIGDDMSFCDEETIKEMEQLTREIDDIAEFEAVEQ